ncbi:type II secretion system F family protein [Arthrobacter sp.]|uniref:type II secretion system F family protein n=1 Tax=Arthrobacter sp. TaxID=1667 RepID=UPI003A8DDDC8
MSVVILMAAAFAGIASWLVPAGHRWPRERPAPAAARNGGSSRRWSLRPGGHRPGRLDVDAHVAAFRHLGALLRSGRQPAESWALLETTWAGRLASAGADGDDHGSPRRRGAGGEAGATAAANDIVEACRAALVAHETGSGPSAGIERHVRSAPGYGHAWERLCWCIRLSESTGAPLGDLLNRLAGQLESEQDARRALEATLAGPRMTQKLLAWLPALGIGLAQLMGADPFTLLTTTTTGRVCLAMGAALWWANALWCRRLLGTAGPARRVSAARSRAVA